MDGITMNGFTEITPTTKGLRRAAQTYRLPADIVAALKSLASDNRRSITSELLIALEKHLTASGKWNRDGGELSAVPVVLGC